MGKIRKKNIGLISFLSGGALYFCFIWARCLTLNPEGNLVASPTTLWADWAAHFTMGSAMAFKQLLLASSPFVIGAPFHYPYLVNLISALLIKLGVPFFSAFVIPSFIFSLLLLIGLITFYRKFFNSDRTALWGSLIFLLNGGLGFLAYLKDLTHSNNFWKTVFFPPTLYTRLENHQIYFENILRSIWIPQRAFQLGFVMGIACLILIYSALLKKDSRTMWKMIAAGLMFGLLPIAHAHSFLCVGIILACWVLGDFLRKKEALPKATWLLFGAIAFVVAEPLVLELYKASRSTSMIKWAPGWYISEIGGNWFTFWIKNWGITPIAGLIGAGLWLGSKKKEERQSAFLFIAPFFGLFLMANLYKFQPWIWDNTKIFMWASLGISGCAGYALFRLAELPHVKFKAAALVLFVFMSFSGFLDAYRLLLPSVNSAVLYTKEDLELADWARSNTQPGAVWLTNDHHNNWVYNLTGAQPITAYEGWLWSHGYDFQTPQQDMKTMFKEPNRRDLFEKYGVQYISVGPWERADLGADLAAFEKNFDVLLKTETYTLFTYTPPKNHSGGS